MKNIMLNGQPIEAVASCRQVVGTQTSLDERFDSEWGEYYLTEVQEPLYRSGVQVKTAQGTRTFWAD